jgi:hypothetical protein
MENFMIGFAVGVVWMFVLILGAVYLPECEHE